ncbi:MAG: hypothetical protein IM638_10555 [Bacteroidetes bacterium]|nr:hypothetical protein [Bacteroidota bacterium]
MSTTEIAFKTRLRIGDQIVPLASELVFGDGNSQDGVENGFLFKLDLGPGDFPPTLNLGEIIAFIENSLGAGSGSLASNSGVSTILEEFPYINQDGESFNSQNTTLVQINNFILNSTSSKFLFSIAVSVQGSDPNVGLIALPPQLSSWLRIDSMSMSFTAQTSTP